MGTKTGCCKGQFLWSMSQLHNFGVLLYCSGFSWSNCNGVFLHGAWNSVNLSGVCAKSDKCGRFMSFYNYSQF